MGLDISDGQSTYVELGREGEVERAGKVTTGAGALRKLLGGKEAMVVALEAGTHSRWVSHLVKQLGRRAVVANPRQTR